MICYDDGDKEDWDEDKIQDHVDEEKKPCDYNACKFPHCFCQQLRQQIIPVIMMTMQTTRRTMTTMTLTMMIFLLDKEEFETER